MDINTLSWEIQGEQGCQTDIFIFVSESQMSNIQVMSFWTDVVWPYSVEIFSRVNF